MVMMWAAAAAANGPAKGGHLQPGDDCCQSRWTGFNVGAGVGILIDDTDFAEQHSAGIVSGSNFHHLDDASLIGIVSVGYDWALPRNLVGGVFADYTFGNLKSSFTLDYLPGESIPLEYDDIWGVGARLGIARACCTLWYATAGYTRMDWNFSNGFAKGSLDGYFLGLGVEHMIRDRLSFKLEYRFSDFGKTTIFRDVSVCCQQTIDIDTETHAVWLSIAYRFQHAPEAPAPLK
jgi:outer membrane immunogenic protein